MATTWGTSVIGLSVGIDVSQSPSTVTNGVSSVTLTVDVFVRTTNWAYQDNQILTLGGALSGTYSYYMGSSSTEVKTVKVVTRTLTVPTSFAGTVSRTIRATVDGAHNGASPTHSRTWTVARRPYAAPAPPSNLKLVKISDTRYMASWTNNPTTGAPWDGIRFGLAVADGDSYPYTYKDLAATATSYTFDVPRNSRFRVAVESYNSAGRSEWAYLPFTKTVMAPPSNLVAKKESVSTIALTWSANATHATSQDVWVSKNNGPSAYLASVGADTRSYSHEVTPGSTYTYRVRARDSESKTFSGWSNTSSQISTATINLGSNVSQDFRWGSKPVQRIYYGDQIAWQRP